MGKINVVNFLITKEFLETVGGKFAVDLVQIVDKKKKAVTDEEIGKKLPLKITEIRTILNRLHYRGIACYQKTRNNKTGWYSYTWEIRSGRIAELILEQQAEKIKKLEAQMNFESTYSFFACKKGCSSFPFEIAAEYVFKCPECGKALGSIDNKKQVSLLNKRIDIMKQEALELGKIV
ncbi:MAG: hypothetical protein ABID38_02645 [Candidatus Diapherotrites archaeon]